MATPSLGIPPHPSSSQIGVGFSLKNLVADTIRDIKANSSRWMSREIGRFAWQQGYGGFGVGKSNIAAVVRYIRNQEQHHRRITFEEEFIAAEEARH